jgi:hypothetical protein
LIVASPAAHLAAFAGAPPTVPDPPNDRMGLDAPALAVDRFSDLAARRLRRSALPSLPGPDAPVDLDAPVFLRPIEGSDGVRRYCYDLDLRPAEPGRFYVFYDALGSYVLTQFPVVDRVPGDPAYSDLWDVWKVTIPPGFPGDNRIRDIATLEALLRDPASGFTVKRTGSLLNAPIVPEGSRASMKADNRDGEAALMHAWYRGKRAAYFYFEQYLTSEGRAPVSEMRLRQPVDPVSAPVSERPGGLPVVTAMPGLPAYSPLVRLVLPNGKRLYDEPLNCPVVGRPGPPAERASSQR